MTTRLTSETLVARDEIVAAPAARACNDQSFELPTGLYVAMGLLFAGFVTVLGTAFSTGMSVSYGVIFALLAAFFAVPAIFPRLAPRESRSKALKWAEFREMGIAIATGRTSARDTMILVLLLPFLILCFAVAVATIAALA
jgi:hypothetical protein